MERIVGEEGSLLQQGDTILVLSNPDLLRSIEDQRDEDVYKRQAFSFSNRECVIEELLTELARHQYSEEYIVLTREYYLNM